MTANMLCILLAIIAYLVGMLAIGFKYANNKTSEDFYLGGRKLGPIVSVRSQSSAFVIYYISFKSGASSGFSAIACFLFSAISSKSS